MFIIVEGPDGAGKTTLVRELEQQAHRTGSGVVLVNPKRSPRQGTLEEYARGLDFYRPDGVRDLILDRSWCSDDVYGPIWREHGNHPTVTEYLRLWAEARGAYLVQLDAPDEELARRIGERGDDDVTPDDVAMYAARYRELELHEYWTEGAYAILDVDHDARAEAAWIVEAGRRWQGGASRLAAYPTYVGALEPSFLFLGDVRSKRCQDLGFQTCFPPYHGSAAREVLWPALAQWDTSYGVLNANEEDLACAYEDLREPILVALGVEAEMAAKSLGLPVRGVVPHPQYVRRFHYAKRADYIHFLRLAADGDRITSIERS